MTAKFDIRKQIDAMTKEELLMLLRCRAFSVSENDVRWVKFEYLGRKADKMALEALGKLRFLSGVENYQAYEREKSKFDKAMRLYDKASAVLQRANKG